MSSAICCWSSQIVSKHNRMMCDDTAMLAIAQPQYETETVQFTTEFIPSGMDVKFKTGQFIELFHSAKYF